MTFAIFKYLTNLDDLPITRNMHDAAHNMHDAARNMHNTARNMHNTPANPARTTNITYLQFLSHFCITGKSKAWRLQEFDWFTYFISSVSYHNADVAGMMLLCCGFVWFAVVQVKLDISFINHFVGVCLKVVRNCTTVRMRWGITACTYLNKHNCSL